MKSGIRLGDTVLSNFVRQQLTNPDGANIMIDEKGGLDLIQVCNSERQLPDYVIIDANCLSVNCISLIEYLSERHQSMKMVVVFEQISENSINHIIGAGAWSVVAKAALNESFSHNVFEKRIVLRENGTIDPIDGNIYRQRQLFKKTIHQLYHITQREGLFIRLNATGLDYSHIARIMFVEPKTLNNIFYNIAKKLNVKDRHNLTIFSIRIGYARLVEYDPALDANKSNLPLFIN